MQATAASPNCRTSGYAQRFCRLDEEANSACTDGLGFSISRPPANTNSLRQDNSKTVKALLIPDGHSISKWVWVRVPLHEGQHRASSVDDVNTAIWMDASRGNGSATSDLTGRSFYINRYPLDEPRDLTHSYTIVVTSQHTHGHHVHPVNSLINKLVPELVKPWRGNVLIFRHSKSAARYLINVEETNYVVNERSSPTTAALPSASSSDCRFREYVKRYMKGRITRYTSSFFPPRLNTQPWSPDDFSILQRFFLALDVTRSWIVGSVALAVASTLSDPSCPNNMNIITSYTQQMTLVKFFTNEAGFVLSRWESITASIAPTLGPLFFAAPNTNQWIAIAAHEIITPVLHNVADQRHLIGWRPTSSIHPSIPSSTPHHTYHSDSPFEEVCTLEESTFSWDRPCGYSCPAIWRAAKGLKGFAHVKWGGMDGNDTSANLFTALFWGAGSEGPSFVPVPPRLPSALPTCPGDLDISWWIPCGLGPTSGVVDISVTQLKITHWPFETMEPLPQAYTVCVAPQNRVEQHHTHKNVHPFNDHFASEAEGSMNPFRGNILVVKHSAHAGLADMGPSDFEVATAINHRPTIKVTAVYIYQPTSFYHIRTTPDAHPHRAMAFADRDATVAILRHCAFAEFVSMMHVDRFIRACGREVFWERVVKRVSPKLCAQGTPPSVRSTMTRALIDLLDGEGGCVVGSVVQGLILLTANGDDGFEGEDLNVLVAEPKLARCLRLLQDEFKLKTSPIPLYGRSEHNGSLSALYAFEHPETGIQSVTVSCTKSPSVLTTLLSSRATSQMNALTSSYLISMYPGMTSAGKGLLAWPAFVDEITDYADFSGGQPPLNAALYPAIEDGGDCRRYCPRVWRQVAGLDGIGVFAWCDTRLSVPFEKETVQWRISQECKNHLCVEIRFVNNVEFRDLIAYAHTCQKARHIVQSVLQRRCQLLLERYLDLTDIHDFWRALNAGRGGITGSAAVWVTQVRPVWTPRNINIVVAHNGEHLIRRFLVRRGWTEDTMESRMRIISLSGPYVSRTLDAHPSTPRYVGRSWRFSKPGACQITVTQTGDRTVFEHLTGVSHTMNTMLVTSSTIIALHAFECIQKLSVWRRGPMGAIMAFSGASTAWDIGGRSEDPTREPSPCRSSCPGLLRRLRGGRGVGLFQWKVPHSVRSTNQRGRVKEDWRDRVAVDAYDGFSAPEYAFGWTWCTCENTECDTFLFPRNVHPALPGGELLSCNPKEDFILRTADAIQTCQPPFASIYKALLFATSCRTPFVVPVPLDHGLQDYRSPDDLRTYTWITRRIPGELPLPKWWAPYEIVGGTTDFATLAYKIRGLLLFLASAHDIGPVNVALREDMQPRPIHGDVLVMLEAEGKIVDLALEDALRLVELIKR
ncbi:hypothetical protein B0H12DRAFT_1068831 [Mycena haematopus]|nr:hypothetical protein B0H12DRAFT_1068831 [Mycena haematopus]